MRQGKISAIGVPTTSRSEAPLTVTETSASRGPDLKRKLDVEEKSEKKPRIDLNFGLDSDDES